MTIGEPITLEQFETVRRAERGAHLCAESEAIVALPTGTGLRFKCRWQHRKNKACLGAQMLHATARRYSFTALTRCKDGYLYVWKTERKQKEQHEHPL